MKKLLIAVVALLVVVLAAALVVPSFIDWNRYKDEIAARAEALTGRPLSIDGDISLRLLPAPALSVADVRLSGPAGSGGADLASLKSLQVRIALLPLLGGQVDVESIRLVRPVITVEEQPDGRWNWDLPPPGADRPSSSRAEAEDSPDAAGSGRAASVSLEAVVVEDGVVVYRSHADGRTETIEDIDARLAAPTLVGPFGISGSLTGRGLPIVFEASIGRLEADRPVPVAATLALRGQPGRVQFGGQFSPGPARLAGRLKAEAGDLAKVVAAAAGGAPAALAKPFALNGQLAADGSEVALNDLTVTLGEVSVSGAASLAPGERPTFDVTLAANYLDFDGLQVSGGPAPPETPAGQTATTPPSAPPPAAPPQAAPAPPGAGLSLTLPAKMAGSINLTVAAASWRGSVVRQLQIAATLSDGAVTVTRAGALLPGGADISLSGRLMTPQSVPRFDGRVEASADNLRALLDWLDLDAGDVPAERLRKLQLAAALTATPEVVQVGNLDLRLDASRVTGAAAFALRTRPAFSANLAVDRINVDGYLPELPPGGAPAAAPGVAPTVAPPPAGRSAAPLAVLGDFDANVQARIGQLTYNRLPLQNLVFDGKLVNGVLTVSAAEVATSRGGELAAAGTVRDFAAAVPTFDLDLHFKAQGLRDLAQAAAVELPDAVLGLQGIDIETAVAGGPQQVVLQNLEAAAGPYRVNGRIGLHLGGARPRIDARLTANDLALDQLLPAAGASAAAATAGRTGAAPGDAGSAAEPGRWSAEPLDLTLLRSFDADLDLQAEAVAARGFAMAEPRLAAILEDGVLQLTRLSGRLFDGELVAEGRLTAREALETALSLHLQNGDLRKLLAMAGIDQISGRGDVTAELGSRGGSTLELVRTLTGTVSFAARDGAVQGLDLGRLSDRLKNLDEAADLLDLLGRSLSGGETRLVTASGNWRIDSGVARTEDTRAELEAAAATLTGTVDLPAWRLDLQAGLRLTDHAEAPLIGVALSGPIDEPERDLKTHEIEQFLVQRIGRTLIRKGIGGDTLRDLLGGDAKAAPSDGAAPAEDAGKPEKPRIQDVLKDVFKDLQQR